MIAAAPAIDYEVRFKIAIRPIGAAPNQTHWVRCWTCQPNPARNFGREMVGPFADVVAWADQHATPGHMFSCPGAGQNAAVFERPDSATHFRCEASPYRETHHIVNGRCAHCGHTEAEIRRLA